MYVMAIAQAPQPFGGVHWGLLAVTAVVSIFAVWCVRHLRTERVQAMTVRVAGWALLILALVQSAWFLLPDNMDVERSLPLHYSDALRYITAIALIWRVRWAVAVSYYWGLTLNPQAIVTPHPTMLVGPSVEFFLYWTLHILVLVAPLVLVWGLGYRPRWRDFGVAYTLALGWGAMAMGVNFVLGTNYAFLNRPPGGDSLVDWLGPWPIYVIWMVVLVAVLWALMTWPWVRQRSKHDGSDRADRSSS